MRAVLISLVVLIVLAALLAGFAFAFQDRLIYYPARYSVHPRQILPPRALEVTYATSEGMQRQFYLPPYRHASQAQARRPRRLWIFFGGNASLALMWVDFLSRHAGEGNGYLLIDYPGYGLCEGKPSPDAIFESTREAVHRVMMLYPSDSPDPPNPGRPAIGIGLLGHSLGAAAALDFAARSDVPADTIVLLSPFTSLRHMARRYFGILHVLLRHNFDNGERLREFRDRNPEAPVSIIHGSLDEIIPIDMGRELARSAPGISFTEIPRSGHNDIVESAEKVIVPLLQ